MRNLAALEIDLAKSRYQLHDLHERQRKAKSNILKDQCNYLTKQIHRLQCNINQRKQNNRI
jgi:hypothetical protein